MGEGKKMGASFRVRFYQTFLPQLTFVLSFSPQYHSAHPSPTLGPIDNLADHIATGASFATNGVSLPLYHP
jgi:hypothetical protein